MINDSLHQTAQIDQPLNSDPTATAPDPRSTKRLQVRRPVVVIPIDHHNAPLLDQKCEGFSDNLTLDGIGMNLTCRLNASRIVVGILGDDQAFYYAAAHLVHRQESRDGNWMVGAEFLKDEKDLFRSQNITPFFDPEVLRMRTEIETETLQKWEKAGVLQRSVFDKVLVCPQCESLPTIREGCRQCGSADMIHQRLIHHYACAYVGQHYEFQPSWTQKNTSAPLNGLAAAEDQEVELLICPKCSVDKMVAGVDYEFIQGPYECRACNWRDTTKEQYAHCLGCGYRGCSHLFKEIEVIGFRVARLDTLAFFH